MTVAGVLAEAGTATLKDVPGTALEAEVGAERRPAEVASLPFRAADGLDDQFHK